MPVRIGHDGARARSRRGAVGFPHRPSIATRAIRPATESLNHTASSVAVGASGRAPREPAEFGDLARGVIRATRPTHCSAQTTRCHQAPARSRSARLWRRQGEFADLARHRDPPDPVSPSSVNHSAPSAPAMIPIGASRPESASENSANAPVVGDNPPDLSGPSFAEPHVPVRPLGQDVRRASSMEWCSRKLVFHRFSPVLPLFTCDPPLTSRRSPGHPTMRVRPVSA